MAVNNPWRFDNVNGEKQIASETDSDPSKSSDVTDTNTNIDNSFGDNFVDKNLSDKSSHLKREEKEDNNSLSFEPLEDSRQYIDGLESKLRKLQKVSLLKALSERKSDEARRLLDSRLQDLDFLSSARISEANIEEEVEDNPLLRKICPERQAVNLSELEKLLDAYSLQKLVEELSNCDIEAEENNKDKVDANHSGTPQ